jgi:uncharacterized protein
LADPESLCVYCRRQPVDEASRPFCSDRCRMADLGRWLSGDYRVPVENPDESASDSPGESLAGRPDDDGETERDN